jgi:hypothetical protein
MKCVSSWCSLAVGLALMVVSAAPLPAQWRRVAAPTNVTVTSDASALIVSWNNMANAVSYVVNRRSPEHALGTAPSSPYSGALPEPGVSYEYQVVSVGSGRNNTAASPWVGYMVPNSVRPGVVITAPRPPRGTITPIPAGPSALTATSRVPGQIELTWQEVPNATGYRLMRSSTAPEPQAKLYDYPGTSPIAENGKWFHTDAPVDLRWTYSYQIYALFGTTLSAPSAVASAASISVIQPTGLRYGVTLTPAPGRVNVALSWSGVANVAQYVITGADVIGMPTITTTNTSYTLPNVPAGRTYRVCVGAVYPYSIGDPGTAPCVDVKLTG